MKNRGGISEYGRLPSTKTLTEGNYARQRLEDLARGQSQQSDEKPVTDCAESLHISLFFDGNCCNQEDADEVYGSPKPALSNINDFAQVMDFFDNYVHDTDDDNWDSVKQFCQRIKPSSILMLRLSFPW